MDHCNDISLGVVENAWGGDSLNKSDSYQEIRICLANQDSFRVIIVTIKKRITEITLNNSISRPPATFSGMTLKSVTEGSSAQRKEQNKGQNGVSNAGGGNATPGTPNSRSGTQSGQQNQQNSMKYFSSAMFS